MFASGKTGEKKDEDNESVKIVVESVSNRPSLFFHNDTTSKEILYLVKYAGPLDQLGEVIEKAKARNEPHLPDTLRKAITQAIIGLDQTVSNVDEGIADMLLDFYEESFPDTYSQALEAARCAAPLEDHNLKQKREEANFNAVNQVFNAFLSSDVYLMSTPYQSSDDDHIYLHEDKKRGGYFYQKYIDGEIYDFALPNTALLRSLLKDDDKFDQSGEDLKRCENREFCQAVLKIITERGHAPLRQDITEKDAIDTFKKYVNDYKRKMMDDQGCLMTNEFNKNIVHLIYAAIKTFCDRAHELPNDNRFYAERSRWHGEHATNFCNQLIGFLQLELESPRFSQILISGLSHHLDRWQAKRFVDESGDIFRRTGTEDVLGDNFFYVDINEKNIIITTQALDSHGYCARKFKKYYEELDRQPGIAPRQKTTPCSVM